MRDQKQPKYLVVGKQDDDIGTVYQIERLIDRAVCGVTNRITLDDGHVRELSPRVRQWMYAEGAVKYLQHILDGTAGLHKGDDPVAWIGGRPAADPEPQSTAHPAGADTI